MGAKSTARLQKIGLNTIPLALGVLVALVVVALILRSEGVTLREIWNALYDGAWESPSKQARTLRNWLPLMFCSLGLLLTFTAGLWNIGIEGQLTMGAIGATAVALFTRYDSRAVQVGAELLMAMLAGAAWALLVGVLKTRGGINEIFGGVALNFIAALFVAFLISDPFAPASGGTGSRTQAFDPHTLLPAQPVERAFISYETIALAVACFLWVAFILTFTRFGLQLKAIGKNITSARALGIATERNLWLALALCGALAGLGGAVLVLFPPTGQLQNNASGGIGFLALLVVLLASVRPWLVPPIAFLFAFLNTGAQRIESSLQLDPSLVRVLQGILVFAVLLFDGVRGKIELAQEKRLVAAEAARLAKESSAE